MNSFFHAYDGLFVILDAIGKCDFWLVVTYEYFKLLKI